MTIQEVCCDHLRKIIIAFLYIKPCKIVPLLKVLVWFGLVFVDTYKGEVQDHHGKVEGNFIQKHSQRILLHILILNTL